MDSEVDVLSRLLGPDLAMFVGGCDRRHPDLATEPFSSFLADIDQIIRAAGVCVSEGLHKPLDLLCASSPKFLRGLTSKARVLGQPYRTKARLKKSRASIALVGLCKEIAASGEDLPDSFGHFSAERSALDRMARWSRTAARFDEIGCERLASEARLMAKDYERIELGLYRISLRRAALILCKSRGIGPDSNSTVTVMPASAAALPRPCVDVLDRSDRLMGGFAFFDHHILVSLDGLESERRGFVVLGERDGECYFLFSD